MPPRNVSWWSGQVWGTRLVRPDAFVARGQSDRSAGKPPRNYARARATSAAASAPAPANATSSLCCARTWVRRGSGIARCGNAASPSSTTAVASARITRGVAALLETRAGVNGAAVAWPPFFDELVCEDVRVEAAAVWFRTISEVAPGCCDAPEPVLPAAPPDASVAFAASSRAAAQTSAWRARSSSVGDGAVSTITTTTRSSVVPPGTRAEIRYVPGASGRPPIRPENATLLKPARPLKTKGPARRQSGAICVTVKMTRARVRRWKFNVVVRCAAGPVVESHGRDTRRRVIAMLCAPAREPDAAP